MVKPFGYQHRKSLLSDPVKRPRLAKPSGRFQPIGTSSGVLSGFGHPATVAGPIAAPARAATGREAP